MSLTYYDIKNILRGSKTSTIPSDDFRIVDSYAIYKDGSGKKPENRPLEYLCYELESINPETGEKLHFYKALKLARVIRLPKSAKQSTSFMDIQQQILSSVYHEGYNFVTIIANIIEPVPLGLLFLYGVQGVGSTIEEAKKKAHSDYLGLIASLQGSFRVLELRTINAQETEWLREKMFNMNYLTVVRGVPKANSGGEDMGNKGIGGKNLNPESQGTLEEFIAGMADYEYVVQCLSTPVNQSTLREWSYQTEKHMTDWNSQLQGSKSLNLGISMPMMYMANQSNSQGWSKAYTNADSVTTTSGESFSTGFGESISESLSKSVSESMGISQGTSVTDSVTSQQSISNGMSVGESHGQTFGETLGQSLGQNASVSSSVGESTNISEGQSINHSTSENFSESLGHTQGQSYGIGNSQSIGNSHSIGQSQNVSSTIGESVSHGLTASTSQSASQGMSVNSGINRSESSNFSFGESESHSASSSHGINSSHSTSGSSSMGWNYGQTNGHTDSRGGTGGVSLIVNASGNESKSDSFSSTNGVNTGYSETHGFTEGMSASTSQSHGYTSNFSQSNGVSVGTSQSVGSSSSLTHGSSLSESATNTQSQSQTAGFGANESYGVTSGASVSETMGVSVGQSSSQTVGNGISNGWGSSISQSQGVSVNNGYSQGQSLSQSASNSESNSQSSNASISQSISNGISQGRSVGHSISESYTRGTSQGISQGYGQSQNVSQGTSQSTSHGNSQSVSSGTSGAFISGASSTMGFGPSISYNKSYQWLDQQVKDILELLEFQNERIKRSLRGEGAFYTYIHIACASADALSAAQAVAKSTWQNEYALVNPLQVLKLTEEEQKHLLYHFNAFSIDPTRENVSGAMQYKYCTVLLPKEFVAYVHLPRISEGGVFADVNDIPKFAVPSLLSGEIYMGSILSAERYTLNNGYNTPYDYRIDEKELMHGFVTGASRSGKTVAAMRFVAELANVRRKSTGKRLRIVCMDPKQDWRTLARFVDAERFRFYSLGNALFRPVKINPLKIPYGVVPQTWIDGVIDIYCRAYGLLERGKQLMGETIYALYEDAGVFSACDLPNWKEVVPELSKEVTFTKVYQKMSAIKASLEDPTNPKGRAGNDTRDAYARLLDRLQCFKRDFTIEHKLFGTSEGIGIDELIGDDDVTILESSGLEKTFKNFIFGVITSGFYKFAKAHEGGYLSKDQYETVLVIEEANEVLIGNDCAGSGSGSSMGLTVSGQSEFEEILDQSAGYGLFIIAITQKIADMPKSIIANSGLVFAGRLKTPDDIAVVIRSIAREERYDDRDIVKWFPRMATGMFVCQRSRTFDFKDAEPILVQIARLNAVPPSNIEIDEMLCRKEAAKEVKKKTA